MRISVEGERSLYVEHHNRRSELSTVVLVHGGGCNRRVWDGVFPALTAAGHGVVTLDLRGCGWSDQDFEAMDLPELGRDVVRVLDALAVHEVDLVGWSLGSAVVVEAAAQLGPRLSHLVTVGSPGPRFTSAVDYSWGVPPGTVAGILTALRLDRAAFYRGLAAILFHQDRPDLQAWCHDIFMSSGARHDETLAGLADLDHRSLLPGITAPTLVVHGRHDLFVALEQSEPLLAGLPDARLRVYEDSGHAPFLEEVDAFNADLIAFLAGLDPTAP
ncbi:MAG: alpha/beta fold hydrolase [Mycobacteriales bacterium]